MKENLFEFLVNNGYSSLYKTKEGDCCIVLGPLSLCNNGRAIQLNYYPQFIDRDMITDQELMYCSARKEFVLEIGDFSLPPTRFHYILFEHYALRIHINNDVLLSAGEQILVDYGHLTVHV